MFRLRLMRLASSVIHGFTQFVLRGHMSLSTTYGICKIYILDNKYKADGCIETKYDDDGL